MIKFFNSQKKIKKFSRILTCISLVLMLVSMLGTVVFAAEETVVATTPSGNAWSDFNKIMKFIAGWIGKLGMAVGFLGAVQFGFAFKNDDADAKTKGLRTLISGFVVYGITLTLNMFGLTN